MEDGSPSRYKARMQRRPARGGKKHGGARGLMKRHSLEIGWGHSCACDLRAHCEQHRALCLCSRPTPHTPTPRTPHWATLCARAPELRHSFLLSSSTVFMFSIQIASTGPSSTSHCRQTGAVALGQERFKWAAALSAYALLASASRRRGKICGNAFEQSRSELWVNGVQLLARRSMV
eukprot:364648-Chlamydomonas_euryale.AAC.3